MKKSYILSVLMVFLLCSFLNAQKIDVYQRPLQSERSHDYDALHYLIKINLDIEKKSFNGETTVTLLPLRDGFDSCLLDAEEFTVTSVANSWGKPLSFDQTEKILSVKLAKTYKYGEKLSFTVTYAGKEPKIGLRFYEKSDEHPALVASDSWPNHVHHWFPCYDYPNDKVTNEIVATVKSGLKVAANGHLVSISENVDQGTSTFHWSQGLPHSTYLIFMAAAPYVVVKDSYGSVPINYWVYPQHADFARVSFKDTPRMMEFFNRIYGYDYPWEKYDQVVVPFGGGAESTTASAMGERIMHDKKGEKDFSNIGIVSHELAHQWWGDLITLRSWAHTWMNESFGTYSDYLYNRFDRGEDEGALNLLGKKNGYLREARNRYMRPIVFHRYNRPQDNFDSHTYPKGAVVLHMLRDIIGDDAFFLVLKRFLHTHAFQPVDTHDFTKTVKQVTGQDLDWFYNQWLFSPGHPVFEVAYSWENGTTSLSIKQTQNTPRVPLFKVPVNIAIVNENGRQSHRVWLSKREETFSFTSPQKPLLVRFDEGNVLLKEWKFEKSQTELLYQLKKDDVIGRMWAAGQLTRFNENTAVLKALKQSAAKDPFWAVRRDAIQSLGAMAGAELVPFFKKMCSDKHSRVRVAALAGMGRHAKPALVSFLKNRYRKEGSYLAQAEVLKTLGGCNDRSVESFLKEAAGSYSPRNILRNAANRALKNLGIKRESD